MFEKYNSNVAADEKPVYTLCNYIRVRGVDNASIYNEFCEKLMRNIRLIDNLRNEDMTDVETSDGYVPRAEESNGDPNENVHCSYLNKWIYYNLKKVPVPEKIIKEIFRITHNMLNANNSSYKCKFESINEDYLDPYNVIKLSFFEDYTETILRILRNSQHQNYSACLNYIRECANTYKKMKNDYCTNYDQENEKHVKTCAELESFKKIYKLKLQGVLEINKGLLDLENSEMDPKIQLELDEEKSVLEVPDVELDFDENSEYLINLLQGNITKGAGITAGAGALLFFLFRFTPAGNLFRSGKGRKERVDNFLQEGPSEELFDNDQSYMHMNSDTMSYNVGYSPT
ncbi:Plasmodium vivax Vir protein, putative [Plasmodium vivax]|uniref:Vir protein, putative n=1 Tax=Plasmodium vivax TaxID=5855 RepID=A0A1G4HDX2_PLAVI|nr:Plasmodium vivax Vir protein, putative [Plasmodium vivax]